MAPRTRTRAKSMDWAAARTVEEEPMLSETSDGGRSVIKAHPRLAWRQGSIEYLGTIPLGHHTTYQLSPGAGATETQPGAARRLHDAPCVSARANVNLRELLASGACCAERVAFRS